MKIAYNPLGSGALPKAPDNKDITFDLAGKVIYALGVPFDGKDTKYTVFKKHTSSDNKGGSEGLVPIPSYSTTNNRLLREDGLWVNITGVTPPDTELDTESTNAVQNKIITNKINEILASMQLKAADVYKNVKVGNTTLVASGINDTLEFKLGNGIIITPNATNKTLEFSINATGNLGINTSYDNNQLVVKILDEYYNKWNAVYDWYISVTKEDTDNLINKWLEIVDFLNSLAEGTDILDEFVTRKTDLTIIGGKTFSKQIISSVAQGTAPFSVESTTVVSKLNADLLDGYNADGLFTNLSNDTNLLSVTIGGTNKKLIIDYANTAGRLEGGSIATWGTLTSANGYTNVATYDYGGTKGAFSFAGKGGQLSLQLDGFFYQNEGRFLVLDTNNYSTHLDNRYYTETEINNKLKEYLPLIGGTMSGPLNFANGTWNSVGDDIAMGDYNAAGMLGLKSLNNDIPGVGFHNSSGTLLGRLQAKGNNLYWNDNLIIHGGNNNLGYIGTTAVQSASVALALTGITNATISNNINLGGELVWSKNTDYAKIYFKNSSDGDTDSYMDLQTGDNGNEYIKFSRNSGGTISTMATIKSEGIRTYGCFISELNSRYVKIGPQNSSHAHYETNADLSHWFNKRVDVNGAIWRYGTNYGIESDGKFYAHTIYANRSESSTAGGVSLYSTSDPMTYGIAFRGTGTYGTHGGVSGDWATYLTMSDTTNRGWIFRRGSSNVFSISGTGYISSNNSGYFAGNLSSANSGASSPGDAALEVREYARAGTNTSTAPHSLLYAPRIGFHWGNRYWGNIIYYDSTFRFMNHNASSYAPIQASTITGGTGNFTNLTVINDSSNTGYDALAYFRHYSNNDWAVIIDKTNSYSYGLDIRCGGEYALKVGAGKTKLIGATTIGADATPSYTLDVRGNARVTGRIYANEWIEFDDLQGLYWPNMNGAHLYANNVSSYGGLVTLGARNGYCGIHCGPNNNYLTVMSHDSYHGLYCENWGWEFFFNRGNGYVGIRSSSTPYPVSMSGDSYTTGWSRAANGFYVENTGVHYTSLGSVGAIQMTSNNEFIWGSSNGTLYFNYRATSRGTTVTHYIWNAGSLSSYANHTVGKVLAQSTPSSWLDGQRYERGGFNLMNATDTGSYWPWFRLTLTAASKWISVGTLGTSLYFMGSTTSRTSNGYDYGFRMDFSNGYLYGNFSGYLSGTATRAEYLSGHGVSPNNSHPGHGARVFYSWNIGQANNASSGYSNGITIGSHPSDTAYGFQIVQNMWDDTLYVRRYNGGWQSWRAVSYTDHGHRITKLHRRDDGSDYSLQHHWTGSYWYLRGYYGDSYHAGVQVAYADWAGGTGSVTVNNSDYNSTYRMVWHSGNTLYSTGGIYCNPASDYLYAGSFYTGNWFRSSGATGWYNESYGGGIYMEDSSWVRTYNGKHFYCSGIILAGNRFYTGYDSGAGNSVSCSNWFRSNGHTGWYNPTYECHVYPNNLTTYGGLILRGVKNGYHGILIGTSTGYMNLMDNGSDKGAYQENWGWLWYFNARNGKFSVRTSSDFGADINLNGSVRTNSTYYGYGLYHLSYGSADYVLTSNGGAKAISSINTWRPIYWAIYLIFFGSSNTYSYTKKAGNHNFHGSVLTLEKAGQVIINVNYPSGFSEDSTMIWGMGDHASDNHKNVCYVTVNKNHLNLRLSLSDDASVNWGYAYLYFLCIG